MSNEVRLNWLAMSDEAVWTDRLAMSDEAKLNWLAISDKCLKVMVVSTPFMVCSSHTITKTGIRIEAMVSHFIWSCNTLLKIFCIYNHTFVSTSLRERAKNMVGVANIPKTTRMTQLSKMISSTLLHFSCCNQVSCLATLAVPLSLNASGFSFPTLDSS